MNNILITSVGQRVSLVKAFKNEIKKVDQSAKVYTVDLNPILAPACHVSDGYKIVPRVTDTTYVEVLLSICKEWGIKLIIPTIDTELEVLSNNRQLFLDAGITPVVSSVDFVQACRDKRVINQFFIDKGVEIPKPIEKTNLTFPLFIKPYDGSLSKDIFLIHKQEDLIDYHMNNPKLMFMEYMDTSIYDEYTVDCYYNKDSELCCAVPRKRIFIRAGEINKGVTTKNELVTFIKEKLSHIEGAIGCLTMQFFFNQETKRIVAIEINSRFGGGYPLSYLAGANYPMWIIQEYILGQSVVYSDEWEDKLLMLRYDNEVLVRGYEG